ncbi:hypothetical protein DAI22_11g146650 [Oryza sativa Japonica Group]|nr:hypothetical protein DAI22_11g146650 [Oryza sativa Japonica Group]
MPRLEGRRCGGSARRGSSELRPTGWRDLRRRADRENGGRHMWREGDEAAARRGGGSERRRYVVVALLVFILFLLSFFLPPGMKLTTALLGVRSWTRALALQRLQPRATMLR